MKRKLLSILLACILALGMATSAIQVSAVSPGEVNRLRDQYSKVINNGDGSFSRITYLGSVHYEDANGNFQPIDTTIVASSKPNWDWEVTTGHWKLFVNNDTTVGVKKGNNWIGTRLHGIAYYEATTKNYTILQTANSVVPVVDDNTITWHNILYGVDYVLYYTADSLKEEVVVHQKARDLLSSAGHRPSDYDYVAANTYLVPIFECDWSQSLQMKLKWDTIDIELAVSPDNIDTDKAIHFEADTPDPYWGTKLVSFLPVYSAISANPINPEDPEEEWEYAECVMKKRLVKKGGKHWLLTGVPVLTLNAMPEGSIIFDPTETLRPSATGDEENIPSSVPVQDHYLCIDEATVDDADYVYHTNEGGYRDLYNLPAHSGSGTINKVTVYFRCKHSNSTGTPLARAAIKSDSTVTEGDAESLTTSWAYYTMEWATNPADSAAWAWADIDALQAGIKLTGVLAGSMGVYCSQVYVVVDYSPGAPTVTTQAVSDITATTATGNGNITATGDGTPTKRGIVYGLESKGDPGAAAPPGGYDSYEEETGSFGTGAFTRNLTNLAEGETYYVRAYAYSEYGYNYGGQVNFTTSVSAPAITLEAATYVAKTTARLNSVVTDDGGELCDVRFGYGTTTQATVAAYDTQTAWVEDTYTTGQHPYVNIDSLNSNDQYFFRCEIRNSNSTVASGELNFTTAAALVAPTNLKAFPSTTTIGLTWTLGAGCDNTMIRYSEVDYPADETEGIWVYFGPLASYTITSLTVGHTYYISAFGNSAAEYTAGADVMATTGGATAAPAEPGAPDEPAGLFQEPDPTQIENFPAYAMWNDVAEDLNIPLNTVWLYIILGGVGFAGFIFYLISHNVIVVMVVVAIGISWGSLIGILPLWMMFLVVILGLGLFQFQRGRA